MEQIESIDTISLESPITAFIWDEFAIDPFENRSDKISNLRTLDYSSIDTILVENRHNLDQVDTVFQFNFGTSKIQVYSLSAKEFTISSSLFKNIVPIKYGIQIGNHKTDIINKLSISDTLDLTSQHFRIEVMEVVQWVDLVFQQDTLTEIIFVGYYD